MRSSAGRLQSRGPGGSTPPRKRGEGRRVQEHSGAFVSVSSAGGVFDLTIFGHRLTAIVVLLVVLIALVLVVIAAILLLVWVALG